MYTDKPPQVNTPNASDKLKSARQVEPLIRALQTERALLAERRAAYVPSAGAGAAGGVSAEMEAIDANK